MKALIAIDGSTESAFGVELAASLAWPSGAELQVLTVLPSETERIGGPWLAGVAYVPSDVTRDGLRTDGAALLERAAAPLRELGLDVTTRLIEGRAASVIVDTARDIGADLVVLGARGHGAIEEAFLGSVSAEVVDQAPCAVLVARGPDCGTHPDRHGRIGRRDVGCPVRRRMRALPSQSRASRACGRCQPDVVAGLCPE